MKDNARHVPGSISLSHGERVGVRDRLVCLGLQSLARNFRSCRTPLSQSATRTRRFQNLSRKSVQNPYKSDRFREVQFFNYSVSTTYGFTALKCTDFPLHPAPTQSYFQPRGPG